MKLIKQLIAGLVIFAVSIPAILAETLPIQIRGTIQYGGLTSQIQTVKDAKPGDEILIFIDSPGGSVAEMLIMIDAMEHSHAAKITSIVREFAASAAADIAVSADRIVVDDTAVLLFHLGSTVQDGKEITFSADMDTTQLNPSNFRYFFTIIDYSKTLGKALGFNSSQIYQFLHGADGLIINGQDFKVANPFGLGTRFNGSVMKKIDDLINVVFVEEGNYDIFKR